MSGIAIIAAERTRQINKEKWTAGHDDEHTDGQLAIAAAVYATPDEHRLYRGQAPRSEAVPHEWPWGDEWWKPTPKNRLRELAKAGALIAAELDRLLRVAEDEP